MRRRLRSTALVLISQMLLIALAVAYLLQMIIIAREGAAYFVEQNRLILYGEITGVALILIFAVYVLVTEIRRLSERRGAERDENKGAKRS
jgi:hypothetical protein